VRERVYSENPERELVVDLTISWKGRDPGKPKKRTRDFYRAADPEIEGKGTGGKGEGSATTKGDLPSVARILT